MSEALAIVRVGLCCPVGLDTAQTATALRAGASSKTAWSEMQDFESPITIGHLDEAYLPPLESGMARLEDPLEKRLLRLATAPLQEVFAGYPGCPPPLFLAAPQPAPDSRALISSAIFSHLAAQSGQEIDVGASRLFATGRAALFSTLAMARDELRASRTEFVLVGGLDSYVDFSRISLLAEQQRLLFGGPRDAFIPGEAAAFVLLGTRASARRHGLRPMAWISALGLAHERGHRFSEEPFLGDALAAAVSQACAGLDASAPPIRLVLAGLNGESMHDKEWGVAMLRNHDYFSADLSVEYPAAYIGDSGAALAPLMLGTTAFHVHRGVAAGPALVWASSDRGQRGALVMRAHSQGER